MKYENMHEEQIARIRAKLIEARSKDSQFKVFGAHLHKYQLGETLSLAQVKAFEEQYKVQLPSDYKAFLIHMGNGGISYAKSAAGPFYGIYPLGHNVGEIIEKPEKYLSLPTVIKPKMSVEVWDSLTKTLCDDDLSDDEYDVEMGKLYAGLMPLGSQGCTYLHALVVSGKFAGRVVNMNLDLYKPQFAFENNFLDWYERWLDEIITGILITDKVSWFGYSMGGNDAELLDILVNAQDTDTVIQALQGLGRLSTIRTEYCKKLLQLCSHDNDTIKHTAIQLLTKFSYPMAINHLQQLIDGDDSACLAACQALWWYQKEQIKFWTGQLIERLNTIENAEAFRYITYLFQDAQINYGQYLQPFCTHSEEKIRVTSYYSLGLLKNKHDFLAQFIVGLEDESPRVVHTTLQALSGVEDKKLLEAYKKITVRFKTDEYYILTNLNHNIKNMGYQSYADLLKEKNSEQNFLKRFLSYLGNKFHF